MKKITFIIYLFSSIMGIQQTSAQTYNLLESFAGTGLQGTFGGTAAVYATNPVGTDQVIMITSGATPNAWQGLDVILTTNYRLTAATQLSMQLDVYSTTAITIAPKAQGGVAGATSSVTTATHNGSGWQTLTFTFDKSLDNQGPANGDYSDFALHINWNVANNTYGTPDGRIFYIKNLKGLSVTAPVGSAPTVAAPTPPVRVATDVISIFSNAYSNVPLAELPTSWSQTTFTALQIQGNDTWKSVGEFLGMVTNPANGVDLSTMEKMHIDYWTPDNNPISVKIVNTINGGEAITSLGTTVTGSWKSIDIDMSAFASTLNKTKITQLLIDPTGPATVYIDNFYFYRPATTVAPTVCAGTSSDAQQGSLSNGGYNHKFETLANGDVQITFELLVAGAAGVVAYLWRNPDVGGFQELPMTVTGTTATKVITGLTSGQDISYAVKFVWAAGGLGVTKYFAYKVGDTCALSTNNFDLTSFKTYPNPTKDTWTVTTKNTNISSIQVYDVSGRNVLSLKPNAIEVKIDASSLKTGVYFARINTLNGYGSLKLIKE